MRTFTEHVAAVISARQKVLGLTVGDLAARVDATPRAVERQLRLPATMTIDMLARIAAALETTPLALLSANGGDGRDALTPLVAVVGPAVAARRKLVGLTQEKFGERARMPPKNVQRLESGTQNATLETIARAARALACSPLDLLAPAAAAPAIEEGWISAERERLEAAGFPTRRGSPTGRRPATAVPLTTLRAVACGGGRPETLAWVTILRKGVVPAGRFVARVDDVALEPRIPSGSLCLFGPPARPPYGDRILLVAHETLAAPYALRLVSEQRSFRTGREVTLHAPDPASPRIVLDEEQAKTLRVIATLAKVLAPLPE